MGDRLMATISGAGRRAKHLLRVSATKLPSPVQRRIVRERHLRLVLANYPELTDPAYLGAKPEDVVTWIDATGKPALPAGGLDLTPLDTADIASIRAWLDAGPYDDDAALDARTDNHGDELGRVKAALRTRLRLAGSSVPRIPANGDRVLVDARSLQTAAFGTRGIGRFAAAALHGVRGAVGDERVVLLVDHGLEPLPAGLAGACEQITRVTAATAGRFSVLIEPSPMTASPDPLLPLLLSTAHKVALVFDFIPAHYPGVYLRYAGHRAEYAAGLDALRWYDEFACISGMTRDELVGFLADGYFAPQTSEQEPVTYVAWPESVGVHSEPQAGRPNGPMVIMTGDEPRKNTYGALAALGAATAGQDHPRDVVVIGMAGQGVRVHHWSIHAAMRPGEATTLGRISDEEMRDILRSASLVIVPSFDEGLSLPVIEAVDAGTSVIASDIPAHRELIGTGDFLFDPKDLRDMVRAIRRHTGSRRAFVRQHARLSAHEHRSLERSLAKSATDHLGVSVPSQMTAAGRRSGQRLRVALATPWTPQPTGVADFSATIGRELASLCDLTVYTTSSAAIDPVLDAGIEFRSVDDALADPDRLASDHDAFVVVLGNSHFHVPFLEIMQSIDTIAVAHDTRMVELYLALRGPGGLQQVMLRGTGERELRPSLDEQIADMRLLQNAGLWEIAKRSRALIMHAETAAPMVLAQTGVMPKLLPFASQRVPDGPVDVHARQAARKRLGWDAERIHLGSFGYVDVRTKQADLVVETAAWLRQWGHDVALHLVGKAAPDLHEALAERARKAGLGDDAFEITGFVDESAFRDHLLAVDLGVQLRVSPLLGVSGPLSDLAAWGTPAVASRGLATDIGAPAYVTRLPDEASPVMAAEAIEHALSAPIDASTREEQRQAYLAAMSPHRYAEHLLAITNEVVR